MTDVVVLDPRFDPEPEGWAEFQLAQRLHPVWDYELMRLEAWVARHPVLLAVVRDEGRIVAVVGFLPCRPWRELAYAPASTKRTLRGGLRWAEIYHTWLSGYPSCAFADDLDQVARWEVLRLFERTLIRLFGIGFFGVVYRGLDLDTAAIAGGRFRTTVKVEGVAVMPIEWPDTEGWIASLGKKRRASVRRQRRLVAADPGLVVKGGLGRTDIDAYEATKLINRHRLRHGAIPGDTRTAVDTAFLDAFLRHPRVHTLTYSDPDGRLLAMNTMLDHPDSPAIQHWAVLARDEGGPKHVYYDAYIRAVEWATATGRTELTAGRGLLEVKAEMGFRERPLFTIVAPRPAVGR